MTKYHKLEGCNTAAAPIWDKSMGVYIDVRACCDHNLKLAATPTQARNFAAAIIQAADAAESQEKKGLSS